MHQTVRMTHFDVSPRVTQYDFTAILLHISKGIINMSEVLARDILREKFAIVDTPGDLQVSESARPRSHERSDQFTYVKSFSYHSLHTRYRITYKVSDSTLRIVHF